MSNAESLHSEDDHQRIIRELDEQFKQRFSSGETGFNDLVHEREIKLHKDDQNPTKVRVVKAKTIVLDDILSKNVKNSDSSSANFGKLQKLLESSGEEIIAKNQEDSEEVPGMEVQLVKLGAQSRTLFSESNGITTMNKTEKTENSSKHDQAQVIETAKKGRKTLPNHLNGSKFTQSKSGKNSKIGIIDIEEEEGEHEQHLPQNQLKKSRNGRKTIGVHINVDTNVARNKKLAKRTKNSPNKQQNKQSTSKKQNLELAKE